MTTSLEADELAVGMITCEMFKGQDSWSSTPDQRRLLPGRQAVLSSYCGRGWFEKKEGAHRPGAARSQFAKPVLFLTKSAIIQHGKKRPQIAGRTGFSIDRTGCSPAVSRACPVSKLAGTAVSFRRSGTAHLEGHIFGLRVLNQDRDRRFDHCFRGTPKGAGVPGGYFARRNDRRGPRWPS